MALKAWIVKMLGKLNFVKFQKTRKRLALIWIKFSEIKLTKILLLFIKFLVHSLCIQMAIRQCRNLKKINEACENEEYEWEYLKVYLSVWFVYFIWEREKMCVRMCVFERER